MYIIYGNNLLKEKLRTIWSISGMADGIEILELKKEAMIELSYLS
jgi:hypothetical protein